MNKKTPVPGYRLLSSPSTKLKLKDNHYQTPCRFRNMGHPNTLKSKRAELAIFPADPTNQPPLSGDNLENIVEHSR